jgi:hypothetical protein
MPNRIVTNGWSKSYSPQIRKAAQRLATQGIAIYPVDPRGMTRGFERISSKGPRRGVVNNEVTPASLFASMDIFAETTGGRVLKYTNDPTLGVTMAAADQRGAYSVGFYAGEPDGKWHRLKVKVSRPDVKLLYQQGYLAEAPADHLQEWSAEQWSIAAGRPVGSTAIHLDATAQFQSDKLNVILQIATADLYFREIGNEQLLAEVEVGMAEQTDTGSTNMQHVKATIKLPENRVKESKSAGIRYSNPSPLKAGATAVRLIVRDLNTGRYGTMDLPVKDIPIQAAAAAR